MPERPFAAQSGTSVHVSSWRSVGADHSGRAAAPHKAATPSGHQPTASPFPSGSTTVLIGGMPALRTTDACLCGAMAAVGQPTVLIG